tara:strand:+ start:39562 stop:39954 length:393 start_codon:yes stop_codon:yes gene_type:complete
MPYYESPFGSADGSNAEGVVHNHFGPRRVGNAEGVLPAKGFETEAVVNFDGDDLPVRVVIPADSYVVGISTDFATGAITAATVGGDDITGAGAVGDTGGTAAVVGPVSGELVITGPTAGSVVVYYRHIAG